jgi:hypothetical protein
MTPLTTFSLFAYLPTELRLKIYQTSLSSPRVVPLHFLSPTTDPRRHSHLSHHGCTSAAPIPALLHVSRESRALAQEYYALSFNLHGCSDLLPPKIWFSHGKPSYNNDILYFGPQAGYLAAFKHFITAMAVLDPSELLKVRKLAVHEDLFVQVRRERGPFEWNPYASRSKDALIDRCIHDFWEQVRRKFKNVQEVLIIGPGMEDAILSTQPHVDSACTTMELAMVPYERQKDAGRYHHHESLYSKVVRAVGRLEARESAWRAPSWRVLTFQDRVTPNRKPRSVTGRRLRKVSSSDGEGWPVERMDVDYAIDDEKSSMALDFDVQMC